MSAAKTIWFTGLSGSGKTTTAIALVQRLKARGIPILLIDGDEIRQGLCEDLGFSSAHRHENARRAAHMAKLCNSQGIWCVVALVSPFAAHRAMVRALIGEQAHREVYVQSDLKVCEQRDPKGHYRGAREGRIPLFTGVDDPYEIPSDPWLRLDTSRPDLFESNLRTLLGLLLESSDAAVSAPKPTIPLDRAVQ